MEWLTIEQVKKEATTPRKALEISIKHWWQNTTATEKELRIYTEGLFKNRPITIGLCGLCTYYDGECDDCPLKSCDENSEYHQADIAITNWWYNKTPENFKLWQQAARAMHKKLCSLRKKRS